MYLHNKTLSLTFPLFEFDGEESSSVFVADDVTQHVQRAHKVGKLELGACVLRAAFIRGTRGQRVITERLMRVQVAHARSQSILNLTKKYTTSLYTIAYSVIIIIDIQLNIGRLCNYFLNYKKSQINKD